MMMGIAISLTGRLLGGAFSPQSLFPNAEPGVWYDPSDVANLSWRRNLLTWTEQFDNAAWVKPDTTVTANNAVAPNGTTTADLASVSSSGTFRYIRQLFSLTPATYTLQMAVKSNGTAQWVWLLGETSTNTFFWFDIVNGVIGGSGTSTGAGISGQTYSHSIESLGNGWYLCKATFVKTSETKAEEIGFGFSDANASVSATAGQSCLIWGAQLEVGSVATEYQRITDVNTEVAERFPTATMFQDRAGTTLVTTPGQSVGLVLDKRLGLTPGPELVATGVTGTAIPAKWTLTGNRAVLVGALAAENAGVTLNGLTGTSGATYKIDVTVYSVAGDSYSFRLPDNSTIGQKTGSQSFSFLARSDGSTGLVRLIEWSGTLTDIDFEVVVREIPGNHMVATADASRGTYGIEPFGGRRNLLERTDEFDNAYWSKSATITANAAVAPDGTTTADLVSSSTTVSSVQRTPIILAANTAHRISLYMKAGTSTRSGIGLFDNTGNAFEGQLYIDWTLGVPSQSSASGNATGAVFEGVGDGWYRVSVTMTTDAVNTSHRIFIYSDIVAGTGNVLIWGAQLEVGSTATNYQRVTTAFDVTEAGVPTVHYVQFDGADDGYLTSTITPGTDKAQVFAGVRKLSDAAFGMIAELSTNRDTNSGAVNIYGRNSAGFDFGSKGTLSVTISADTSNSSPITRVLSGTSDMAGDVLAFRSNGTQVSQSTADQGTGNYLAYPLYIGRRGGTTLPFNGRLYQMVVRFGPNLDAARIAQVERFMAQKTGVTL